MIPKALLDGGSVSDIKVYCALEDEADEPVVVSIEDLSHLAKVPPRTVRRAIRRMERLGVIRIRPRRDRTTGAQLPNGYEIVEGQ